MQTLVVKKIGWGEVDIVKQKANAVVMFKGLTPRKVIEMKLELNIVDLKRTISLVIRMIYFALHFIATIFINRGLTTNLKGEYAYIINIVSVLAIIGGMGLDLLFLEFTKKYGKKVLGTFLGLTYIYAGMFFILSIISQCRFHNQELFWILLLTSAHVLYANISTFACVKDIASRNIILLIIQIVYICFLAWAYFNDYGNLNYILFLYLLNDVLVSLILVIKNKYHVRWSLLEIGVNHITVLKKITHLGIKAMLISLLIAFNYNLDIIMLKKMGISLELIGIYSVAVTLSNIVLLIPDAFKELALGIVVCDNAAHKIKKYLQINVVFLIIIAIGFCIFGKWFINCFYGSAYITSYQVTLILFIGDLFICIYKVIHPLLIADGKQTTVLKYLIIAVMINFIMNIILIPIFNIFGAALASVGSYFVTGVLFYIHFQNNYLKVK